MNEIEAIDAYRQQHATCDIQRHPWQAVFGAGFGAGQAEGERLRAALRSIAEQTICYVVGDHQGPYDIAVRMRAIAGDALDQGAMSDG